MLLLWFLLGGVVACFIGGMGAFGVQFGRFGGFDYVVVIACVSFGCLMGWFDLFYFCLLDFMVMFDFGWF